MPPCTRSTSSRSGWASRLVSSRPRRSRRTAPGPTCATSSSSRCRRAGRSPDLLETVSVGRECGATVIAVTNAPDSELSRAADLHVDVDAGVEQAVAATKSYTAELLALWLLVEAWRGRRRGGGTRGTRGCARRRRAGRRGCAAGGPLPVHGPACADRPWLRVPHGSRGGAQAHGDVVRRRPRVQRCRPHAWSARDGRRGSPGCRRRPRGGRRRGDAPGPRPPAPSRTSTSP